MSEAHAAHGVGQLLHNVEHSLGKKIGPLPLGAWAAAIVGGVGVAYYINKRHAVAADAAAPVDPSQSADYQTGTPPGSTTTPAGVGNNWTDPGWTDPGTGDTSSSSDSPQGSYLTSRGLRAVIAAALASARAKRSTPTPGRHPHRHKHAAKGHHPGHPHHPKHHHPKHHHQGPGNVVGAAEQAAKDVGRHHHGPQLHHHHAHHQPPNHHHPHHHRRRDTRGPQR